ncbi:hypothetical protein [Klebsiella variicola]|uniref:hypothetical protein n=1 Tax=Klebsiella variicola TaxID=244366 RepID=UPI0025A659E0|nr:hypothetical protein [Klebsiella variicola]WJP92815.1 hypothetical protein QSV42_20675 [Klebsiella variicola]
MTKSTKGPLFAEVHNVPDDYHFTEGELDRIIAGDMFTPRQTAIMARELQERRKAMTRATELLSGVVLTDKENLIETIGRIRVVISGDYSDE